MSFNLTEALAATIQVFGGRPAMLTASGGGSSWRTFGDRVARLAGGLAARGLSRGDRFAILAANSFRLEEAKWAGFRLGAVPVPLNRRLAGPEIRALLEDCGAKLLCVDAEHKSRIDANGFGCWRDSVLLLGEEAVGVTTTDELIAQSAPAAAAPCVLDDDAILFYTGGTTGRSKGVRLTQGNVLFNAFQTGMDVAPRVDDVYLHLTPMFHSAELLATPWMLRGAAHVHVPAFSPTAVLDAIERHRVTCMNVVPTILIRLISDPSFAGRDLSSLRVVLFGSASMTAEWVTRVVRALPPGVRLLQGYGLTETAPNVSMLEDDLLRGAVFDRRRPELVGSVGKPMIGVAVRIVDGDGAEVVRGDAGEVQVKGPNVMKAYLDRPEETAKVLTDGWLATGDLGRLDEDGNLFILDRIKDMIITGGENVYSAEVETTLSDHPAILEASIFGVPDDIHGEAVCAAVVMRAGEAFTADDLVAFCRTRIAGYKIPRLIAFVEELPRTPVGKIAKGQLRQIYSNRSGFERLAPRLDER